MNIILSKTFVDKYNAYMLNSPYVVWSSEIEEPVLAIASSKTGRRLSVPKAIHLFTGFLQESIYPGFTILEDIEPTFKKTERGVCGG